ncbi:MAG TPA: TerB family tellurite resistance protein [Polyangiales bacterium]
MRLDSETLLRLRDELRRTGERRSLPPSAPPSAAEDVSQDVLAVVQRVAPMCEVLYLLMVADEHSDQREVEVLRGAIRTLTQGALRTGVIDGMLHKFEAAARTFGRDGRLAQVTSLIAADRQDAEAAYTLAAVMAIADETSDERERAWLEELRELLGINAKRASTLRGELGL